MAKAPVLTAEVFLFLLLICVQRAVPFFAGRAELGSRRLQSVPPLSLSLTHAAEQMTLFRQASQGKWLGIQTGYAPQDDMVEDFMYTEVTCSDTEGGEFVHTNGWVAAEIRADCETCYDSERLQTREVGRYREGKLPNIRVVGNCILRGPAPTRVGMSAEVLLYHPDSSSDMRIRVLFAFKPLAFQDVEGFGQVPSALGLADIVIVRERKDRRPLKLDENPDELWRPVAPSPSTAFGADYELVIAQPRPVLTERLVYRPSPDVIERTEGAFPQAPLKIAVPEDADADASEQDDERSDNTDTDVYSRAFPGDIRVEAGSIIYPGIESKLRVTWQPLASRGEKVLYSAEVAYKALENVSVDERGLKVSPPELIELSLTKNS